MPPSRVARRRPRTPTRPRPRARAAPSRRRPTGSSRTTMIPTASPTRAGATASRGLAVAVVELSRAIAVAQADRPDDRQPDDERLDDEPAGARPAAAPGPGPNRAARRRRTFAPARRATAASATVPATIRLGPRSAAGTRRIARIVPASAAGRTRTRASPRTALPSWPAEAPRRSTMASADRRRRAIASATRARLARITTATPVHRIARIVAPDCQRAWWVSIRPRSPVWSDAGPSWAGPAMPPPARAGLAGG